MKAFILFLLKSDEFELDILQHILGKAGPTDRTLIRLVFSLFTPFNQTETMEGFLTKQRTIYNRFSTPIDWAVANVAHFFVGLSSCNPFLAIRKGKGFFK